jgi:formylglycine-generating enzyme required for sulfatase activity
MATGKQPLGPWVAGLVAAICVGACERAPQPAITAADGSQMIYVPAGEFLMGGREEEFATRQQLTHFINYEAERPVHPVTMQGFYLDKHEITQSQYGRFLQALAADSDRSMEHSDQPAGLGHEQHYVEAALLGERQPAVGLNWFDAYAYCRWARKRLPTEAEWEYAARGGNTTYRTYPWGDAAPNAEGRWRANFWPAGGRALDGFHDTAPVGSFPDGASPFGIMDMAGNAEEWVQDWLDLRYYRGATPRANPTGPATGTVKVIKGGSQASDQLHIRIATRLFGDPSVSSPNLGVRCACDP